MGVCITLVVKFITTGCHTVAMSFKIFRLNVATKVGIYYSVIFWEMFVV